MEKRLTEYAHGGGCGCKISPKVLKEILAGVPGVQDPHLLVGFDSSDDAAVYKVRDDLAIVATTDFFTPIVDDPHDFGRIAASNAISDIYAMGAKPIMALGIVGMPIEKLPTEVISRILAGGKSVCDELGVPLAGGHSIDTPEPIYGLVVIGTINPSQVKRNNTAQVGDLLVLSKPIGIGVLSAAMKKNIITADEYRTMLNLTTQINTPGASLAVLDDVHAITDVTGFGLLGHAREMAMGSSKSLTINYSEVPKIEGIESHVENGVFTGASTRNWESYQGDIKLPEKFAISSRHILTDPQTSGGLLVSVSESCVGEVLSLFNSEGFSRASVIGRVSEGQPGVVVLA